MILLILADILKLFFFQGSLVQPLLPPSFLSPTWLIYFPTTFPGGVYFATIQVSSPDVAIPTPTSVVLFHTTWVKPFLVIYYFVIKFSTMTHPYKRAIIKLGKKQMFS